MPSIHNFTYGNTSSPWIEKEAQLHPTQYLEFQQQDLRPACNQILVVAKISLPTKIGN